MTRHRGLQRIAPLLGALALGGCTALLHHPPPPAPTVPPAFTEPQSTDAGPPAADWWRGFGSADLSDLVAAALDANPDLGIAVEHVRQAEAQVRIAGASLFPVVTLGAGTSRRESRESGGTLVGSNSTNATLNASYEIDLWGRNAFGVSAARSELRATRFDQETARLTVVTGVADAYFEILSLRARLVIARKNLADAERVLKVVDSRVRNGANSALDLARQQAAVLSQQAAIPPLELQERQTLFALAILLGRPPEGFDTAAANLEGLTAPRVAPGLPSQLLVRRPDLASAEAQLAAANADVGAARAALLPSIQLTGSAGLASSALINVLKAPTLAFSIGASLLQPIFEGGRLRAQVTIAESRERELALAYRKAVLAALSDVESALSTSSHTDEQVALQMEELEQARRALALAEVRYRAGADDLLVLLDAQRTLFQAEDQLGQLRLAQLEAAVDLFKALGGGWVIPEGS
ncbi:MAG TPA: efflux transporter outer membrane subunit [Vicinamibacteria bacterium]|nr:efflux transporter outer membrane subunit [Vicinamibacteria bacterium]